MKSNSNCLRGRALFSLFAIGITLLLPATTVNAQLANVCEECYFVDIGAPDGEPRPTCLDLNPRSGYAVCIGIRVAALNECIELFDCLRNLPGR